MERLKVIQQLLRPVDTCLLVAQGCLLGLPAPSQRLCSIVKHEGTEEHALFLFDMDRMESTPKFAVDRFFPIRGSFHPQVKAVRNAQCQVMLDTGEGSCLMLQLPYETHTAHFIQHLTRCLHLFLNSDTVNSPTAFSWLSGYQYCRTGWDRFSRPNHQLKPPPSSSAVGDGGGSAARDHSPSPVPLIDFGSSSAEEGGEEDEDEGKRGCESLLQDFDPLHKKEKDAAASYPTSSSSSSSTTSSSSSSLSLLPTQSQPAPVDIAVINPTPENSPLFLTSNNPFLPPPPLTQPRRTSSPTPFQLAAVAAAAVALSSDVSELTSSPSPTYSDTTSIRHCISDSNLLQLSHERRRLAAVDGLEPLVTRSEEDLTLIDSGDDRHCVASQDRTLIARRDSDSGDDRHCVASQDRTLTAQRGSDDRLFDDDSLTVPGNNLERSLSENEMTLPDRSDRKRGGNKKSKRRGRTKTKPKLTTSTFTSYVSSSEDDLLDHLDYKNRRTRSVNELAIHEVELRDVTSDKFRKKLDFLVPSGSKPGVSKAVMNSPELSSRRRAKSRDRSGSRPMVIPFSSPQLVKKSQWVSRYRPGVPVPTGSARESIVQAELRQREKDFCLPKEIRIFCGTWNVNGKMPPSSLEQFLLKYELKDGDEHLLPHIYAVAFQEMDLSAQCLVSNESSREDPWIEAVSSTLRLVGNYTYHNLCAIRLVGIFLLIYIRADLKEHISEAETEFVPTGMHGLLGNKGAVAVHFNVYHSSLCFVNAHLPAHMEEVDKRNQDYGTIMDKMEFTKSSNYAYTIMDHDMVFWLGDLNYRITTTPEMTTEMIKVHANNYQINRLLEFDQLRQEMEKGAVFAQFTEGDIDFKPTYKYDPNTDRWDTSEKSRAPAWCDRVLYSGRAIYLKAYQSHPKMRISDHKPVSAIFDTTIKVVDSDKERLALEQITWKLDKLENDTLPQVDLNTTEFQFRDVKFSVPQSKKLFVTNTGHRPVHVSFIPKLDQTTVCHPWIDLKPSSAVIQPLEDVIIHITVLVDEDTASPLTLARGTLDDILVLHLEKGKDFFVSITGNYVPSVFGSSLETLVHVHTYIGEVPVAQLVDLQLTSSWEQCSLSSLGAPVCGTPSLTPPLDIPKEVFQMVDFLNRYGLEQESLLTDGGRSTELEAIRDFLDMGGPKMPGSTFSVAAALLQFLSALTEPVIPSSLHQKCMDCCNNVTLCRQVLTLIPRVHRRTFVFLITFMKNLLDHSEVNGLDPKVLATIFGDVMLKAPIHERRSKSKRALASMGRKKATFIYQFLVNDITINYR